ncbi:TetR/AcrR family transcriptional regulator [Rhodobacter ferrooxidans]|uniref:Transcriptional regulator, TetR family n=1 Tax=Rhodobacter ferrooxidans TaxID=371731 RepID=C8S4C5_9RHOB|nr:TetR/AcrR family transcriptional regulator [Rhodobacter sp. SW2]EEW24184.1 transcriptional regulator, TetR family [Rhodobacter sp. SW2]
MEKHSASNDREPKFRRRAGARPDEVLDAALHLFTEAGFERTTVEQIAHRAGLSKAAVYLYFPSKKALLAGLVRRAVVPLADRALAQITSYQGDPRPVLRAVMTQIATNLTDPSVLAVPKLVLREAVTAPEIAQMYREEMLDRVLPALTALIAQGVAGGHIRAVDPSLTLRSLIGPVFLHILLAEVFGILTGGELAMQALIDNHLTLLFAGLEPEGKA